MSFGKRDHKPAGANASVLELNTGNGKGAVNTAIRRYSVIKTNTGPAMTYADSANDGMSVTINLAGTYFVSIVDRYATIVNLGITVNSNQLTTAYTSTTLTHRLGGTATSANTFIHIGRYKYFSVGDVIRSHHFVGGTPSTASVVVFYMIYMGE